MSNGGILLTLTMTSSMRVRINSTRNRLVIVKVIRIPLLLNYPVSPPNSNLWETLVHISILLNQISSKNIPLAKFGIIIGKIINSNQ